MDIVGTAETMEVVDGVENAVKLFGDGMIQVYDIDNKQVNTKTRAPFDYNHRS